MKHEAPILRQVYNRVVRGTGVVWKHNSISKGSSSMPIFISYSHADRVFINKLAAHLVKHNAHVWIDSWELNVGDSLIQRIQQAIQESSALLVVLSKASVKSEWCKKELSAGLVRELEEKSSLLPKYDLPTHPTQVG